MTGNTPGQAIITATSEDGGLTASATITVVAAPNLGIVSFTLINSDTDVDMFELSNDMVINQSQSMNVGPHDGTTLLEQAINRELGFPGRAYVCSSGNQADNAIAVSGSVPASGNLVQTFSVPAGLPAPLVQLYNSEINKALLSPEVSRALSNEGAVPTPTTPQAFAQLIASEIPRWATVIQRGNVKLD